MVLDALQLPVRWCLQNDFVSADTRSSFPLEIVFRIYDNILASGIEAVFGFSVVLLQKSEEALLKLKFDEILTFLKNRLFEFYVVSALLHFHEYSANGGFRMQTHLHLVVLTAQLLAA